MQVSKSTFHVFVNSTSDPVELVYFYGELPHTQEVEVPQGPIQPGSNLFVGGCSQAAIPHIKARQRARAPLACRRHRRRLAVMHGVWYVMG